MLLHDWYGELGVDTRVIEECRKTVQCIIPNYVIESKLTLRARYLYDIYAVICQGGNGICWASTAELCSRSGLSRQGVIDSRRELEHFGFIEVRRPVPMFGPNCNIQVSLRHPEKGQPVEPFSCRRPDSPYQERREHGVRRKKDQA